MAKAVKNRRAIEVHLDAPELGERQHVGTMYWNTTVTGAPTAFEYESEWLKHPQKFALDPRLELWRGEQHPPAGSVAFGIFLDSAPDRWGRVLMERREAKQAKVEARRMRALTDIDFLLGVFDHTRMGALRFCEPSGHFLDNSENSAPPATNLNELADISRRLEDDGAEALPEYEQWLAMLIAPGTSLGGARPKANFTETDDSLWLAKFPAKDDRYDVGGWEYMTHQLAKQAGIIVPCSKLLYLGSKYGTFCSKRFDRHDTGRRMYASAMTLLGRKDGEDGASYLDLVEFISDQGAAGHVNEDLEQLFRRVVFNILVGNRDDHMRNHGFIREHSGWRLSPAFDMNPNVAKSMHALAIDAFDADPNIAVAMETAEFYRLTQGQAQQILAEVQAVIKDWRAVAAAQGLSLADITRMESVIQA
jgi:serine/threonine-protein kinase HipA